MNFLFKKLEEQAWMFEHEPQITQKLFDSDVCTFACSSATKEVELLGGKMLKNIDSFLRDKTPPDLVKIKKSEY